MPAISYCKQNIECYHFDEKILQGIKIHTIRKYRKRPFKLGDRLIQYAMQRSPQGYKITENICLYVADIIIFLNNGIFDLTINDKFIRFIKMEQIAFNDGFNSFEDFKRYFIKSDLPFKGQIIGWKEGINY